MQIHARHYWIALAVLFVLAVPAWAHSDTAQLTVTQPATIGTTQLKPGDYKLEVKNDGTRIKVIDSSTDRTVAEVPCHWVQLKEKPNQTEVLLNANRVTEIDFGGTMQAARVVGG
ncbi:MAG TPA: hypothetical protein VMH00_03885 [Candidatus Limnocylindrales bacterium]|nr:hypothetical protein [Candidatus Limnocylindrales bacterium]